MIYIFDKKQAIIKVLTNDDFTVAHLNFKINTATTFEFSLPANKALPSDSKYVATPHPLDDSKFIMLRLTERVDNTETIDYSAYELAYQELATDGYIEDKRPAETDAKTLMQIALNGTNWELNNVNVAGTAKTNFYYTDHLSAISNVVDLLGGEIVFYIEIQGNAISGRYMDYLARQGADTSKVFASGSNLLTVERQSDTSNIYTAILPRGKGEEIDNGDTDTPDGYGRRINIADVEWKKSAGKPLDKPKGSIILSDPDATAEWGQINGNARLLLQTYDDIDDVNVLINSAYKTLQSVNHPQIQYSATVADVGGLSLGDTVLIMHGDRDLSYKTRVFEVKYDLLSPDQTELSLGDDLSSNSITSQLNNLNAVADTTSSQTQWTINQIGRPSTTFGNTEPTNPKVGDVFFKELPDGGTEIYRWNGDIWELLASPTTADDIANAVDDAVSQANAHTDEVKQGLSTDIDTAKSQAASQASTAEANAKSAASSQFTQAQSALSAAKTDLTNSIASEASARNTAVAAANSQAQTYANQAKADAMSAASSADGAIRTAISSSADSLSATITQNKSSADSGISTAQTTAQAAVDGLKFKVSQTDYDQKTGDLSTKINDVKQTADSSAQTIADIKIADGKQDSRMSEIENTASGLKSTVSDLQTTQGKQSGYISTLQQRADGFDATVTKVNNLAVGGRNIILGTETDIAWTADSTNNYSFKVIATGLKPNQTYTFSAEVTLGNTDQKITTVSLLNENLSQGLDATYNFKADGTRDHWTFTVPSTVDTPTASLLIYAGNLGNTGGKSVTYHHTKLETGNMPTDWTPAPEDVDSATAKAQLTADNAALNLSKYQIDADGRISQAQADIKVNADSINKKVSQTDYDQKTGDLSNKISTAQQTADGAVTTVGNYQTSNDARVKAAESKIEQNSKDITSKVSQTDYDQKTGELSGSISTLKQRADGFDATVTKVNNLSVGGRNLLLGTATPLTVQANDNNFNFISIYDHLKGGTTYTFSAEISVSNGQDSVSVGAFDAPIGTEWAFSYDFSKGVKRGSFTFTTPDNIDSDGHFLVYAGTQGHTAGLSATYTHMKLEEGNVPTAWTLAPEDVESDIAQVKITADGIDKFVRDSSGNISSDFQTALSKTSIIAGSTLATSIQQQTATQITSALTDNNGKIISLINQDTSGVQIAGKNIILDGNVTATAAFWANQINAVKVNASNITAGTLNAANVNIVNLDVNSLTGNVSNFIQSNWNGEYSSTKISSTGMQIGGFSANGFDTIFDKTGITFETTDARYGYAIAHYGTDTITNSSGQVMAHGMEIRTGNENGIGFDYFAIKSPGANNLEFGKTTNAGHVSIAVVPDTNLMPILNQGVTILDDLYFGKVNGANAGGLFSVLAGRTIHIATSMNSNGTVAGWLTIQL